MQCKYCKHWKKMCEINISLTPKIESKLLLVIKESNAKSLVLEYKYCRRVLCEIHILSLLLFHKTTVFIALILMRFTVQIKPVFLDTKYF